MTEMLDPVTRHQIAGLTESLVGEFAGIFSRETIARYISESADILTGSKIVDFVPVLSYRFARERLKALGQAEGSIAKEAGGFVRLRAQRGAKPDGSRAPEAPFGGTSHVRSAGSEPAEALNPAVVEAMAEIGVDMGEEFPKPLTDEVVRAADVVVTMGCGDACPIYPGKRYEDWELDDPAEKDLETVRRIRDDIDRRVQNAPGRTHARRYRCRARLTAANGRVRLAGRPPPPSSAAGHTRSGSRASRRARSPMPRPSGRSAHPQTTASKTS